MFAAGQMVFHKSGSHSGTVVDTDGDTVYIMQANGVEIDFPRRDLTTTAPAEDAPAGVTTMMRSGTATRPAADRRGVAEVITPRPRQLIMADITDEHRKVLAVIPKRTLESVGILHDRQPGAGRFAELDVARKLNFIAEVTEIPYRLMKQNANQPGTLGLMMGRGLAARLRPNG